MSIRGRLALSALLVVVLAACPNPTTPPAGDNNPPSASFPPTGYQVNGAGSSAVDGNYTQTDTFDTFPVYSHSGGSYVLYNYWTSPDYLQHWQLNTAVPMDGADADLLPDIPVDTDIPYYGPGAPTSPEGTYATGSTSGYTSPGPTVLRMPISGETAVGSTMTAHYNFSDPDGDGDASTFQWQRSPDASTWTDIFGATTVDYDTVDPDDTNKYLRIEVTPVDARGAAGTPVLSDPIQVGSS